jgi:hypothetical protein
MDGNRLKQAKNAPVAQWIEQRFPKPRAQVRFLPGAFRSSRHIPLEAGFFTECVQTGLFRANTAQVASC